MLLLGSRGCPAGQHPSHWVFLPSGVTLVRGWGSPSRHHSHHSGCPGPPPSGWGKVVDLEWSGWGGVRGDWAVPRLQWVSAHPGGLTSDLWSCPLVVHSDSNGKGNQCSCGILEAPDAGNRPPWSSWNPQCFHLLFSWVFPSSLLFILIHKGMFSLQGFIPKLLRPSTLEPAC